MPFIYLLFITLFLSKELFFFDEEFLVVTSFFIIFSILYQVLSSIISLELDERNRLIYDQFLNYLKTKKNTLTLIYLYYEKRNLSHLFWDFSFLINTIILIIKEYYKNKAVALFYWKQRLIITKLLQIMIAENLYMRKIILNLLLENKELNITFLNENLLLNQN